MATKIKLMKLLQEMRGFSELGRRPSANRPSSLYLLQLRSHLTETSRSKRRLVVSVDLRDTTDFPHPVKINYIKPTLPEEINTVIS